MVQDLVFGDVVEGILEGPVGDGIALSQSSADGGVFELVDGGPLESLPPRASVHHAVGAQGLQSPLERFHLAHFVVLLDVLFPQVRAVPGVVSGLVAHGDALGAEDLGFEVVGRLQLAEEGDGFVEEMEGVHHHHLALSAGQVAHAVEEMGDHHVAGDHGVGEDGVAVVLHAYFEGTHGLFLQMLQTHLFGFGDVLFLVEDFRHGQTRDGRRAAAAADSESRSGGNEGGHRCQSGGGARDEGQREFHDGTSVGLVQLKNWRGKTALP
mmetsp:Transcript_34870/g.80641  ORF Transcript_34870/g.80641 Transcript_34870/m.80641 type:complete len:267 (-) Transcript_34870:2-802(-)